MYNMDQMTNNIAIPKHTLPNPSNLATSRSIISDENGDSFGEGGGGGDEREVHHDSRFSPSSGTSGPNNHLDESRREGGSAYDDEDGGPSQNENAGKSYSGVGAGGEAQGKRGIYKEAGQSGQDEAETRDENGRSELNQAISLPLFQLSRAADRC
jgi:hypothetical protein